MRAPCTTPPPLGSSAAKRSALTRATAIAAAHIKGRGLPALGGDAVASGADLRSLGAARLVDVQKAARNSNQQDGHEDDQDQDQRAHGRPFKVRTSEDCCSNANVRRRLLPRAADTLTNRDRAANGRRSSGPCGSSKKSG